jgi:L-lactate dehydrogenase
VKVGIVGSGFVGATAAYAIVMRGVAREVVLVDLDVKRSRAEAEDIRHAAPFAHPVEVRSGGYGDLAGCGIVILTAGVGQRPGETRLELLGRNAAIFEEVVARVAEAAPGAVLVVATNPVDIMTHLTARFAARSGIGPGRVLGSGTTLDTARFRAVLGGKLGVDAQHVHAYVLGEHGDSEVFNWSAVSVGGLPLASFPSVDCGSGIDGPDRAEIEDEVRGAAYRIIEGKKATYYGIGSALARIVETVSRDQRAILTVCAPPRDGDCVPDSLGGATISLPRLVGGAGILATMAPSLDAREAEALAASARVVMEAIDSLAI